MALGLLPMLNPFNEIFFRGPYPQEFPYQVKVPHVLFLIFDSWRDDDIFWNNSGMLDAFVWFPSMSSFQVVGFWVDFHRLLL